MHNSTNNKHCVNCSKPLVKHNGVWVCVNCNPDAIDVANIFVDEIETDDYVFVECPGATLYDEETGEVTEGVRFRDRDDATKGYDIVGTPVFAPNHKHRRRIRREAQGKIRRCRACQDYTIRMRRKEGRDFFIPSVNHPRRTSLKPMEHVHYEPR